MSLEPLEAVLVLCAGLVAGTINTIVGAGTLVTFPALLAVGLPPVTANISNTVGLVPGSFSGAWGYRRELSGHRRLLVPLGIVALVGGITGAALLLAVPAAFSAVVPALVALGCVLVVLQPRLSAWLRRTRPRPVGRVGPVLAVAIFGTSVYGGYFGAAQGVLHVAFITILAGVPVQQANAVKNVLGSLVNLTAAALFVLVAEVAWAPAALVAVGSTVGGQIGAAVGRRLPDAVLRGVIVLVGTVVVVHLVTT